MMTARQAATWLRTDSQDRRNQIKQELADPSVDEVDREMIRRGNEALGVVLDFVDDVTKG